MSWQNHRKQRFYYKRVSRNGKSTQVYLGRGEAAYAEEAAVAQRKLAQEVSRQVSGVMKTVTAPVITLASYSNQLARATLMASGFRQHHREWRRNHGPQHD